jgi:hypothetical protein
MSAERPDTYRYGGNGTIHRTHNVNVEVDEFGYVVAVWFRCHLIPFDVTKVGADRSADMGRAYRGNNPPGIEAIEFLR